MKAVKRAKIAYIIASSLMIALGLLFIIFPRETTAAACYVLGAVMILFGLAKIVGYFSKDLFRLAFQFDLALGLMAIILGVLVICYPNALQAMLPYVVGVYAIIDGIAKFQISVDAKRFGYKKWWILIVFALLTTAAGVLLIVYPAAGTDVLLILLGISLILDGAENLYTVLYCVKVFKNFKKDAEEFADVR